MKTELFFYTGTGNSYWTARTLAEYLGSVGTRSMLWQDGEAITSHAEALGFIFPVHIWGLPHRVIDFVNVLVEDPPKYYFAIAVNAGQVAATLLQLKKLMSKKGLSLDAGFDIVMPSNYIPWGGPGSEKIIKERIDNARDKIAKIAALVAKKEKHPVERGPLWQNILLSGFLYKLSFPHIPNMDKGFWVDDKCNTCGICKTICPCNNIELKDGRPVWLHRCEQCLACIQWCPKEAIQLGKKTPKYERYHHPDIRLQDMLSMKKSEKKEIM
ncbi:MAG: EFR1 family ferrodoxin [Deltaproteobacteria bacterium]|nr:EFR1 family ferrodoxin [Deltaproteobacteria bacterium]